MKFAICNEIFQGWPVERVFGYAAGVGYDAVEIAPFTLAPQVSQVSCERRKQIRAAAANAGIAISGIHWVLVQTEGLHITHPDPAVRSRTADYFMELVGFCDDLGGRSIVVGSPKQRQRLDGVTEAQARDWALEVFGPAAKRAEGCGVTLCLEPLAPSETNFVNTAADAVGLVGRMGSKAFRLILDVKAMSSEAMPIPEIIAASREHLAYFHANDANLKGPGFGAVDFVPIAAALRNAGYDGYVSVEVFDFTEGPEAIATQSLAYLRKCF